MSRGIPKPDILDLIIPSSTNTIILFGNSITEWSFEQSNNGFGYQLEQYYMGKAQVCNRGVAGYTSSWLKEYFKDLMHEIREKTARPPLFFTIMIGANDACTPGMAQHVPLPEFERNIKGYVDEILTNPATEGTRVVLITCPPIGRPAPSQDALRIRGFRPDAIVDEAMVQAFKENMAFQTYLRKKQYAEKIMGIAKEYENATDRVAGLNCWKDFVDKALGKELSKVGTMTKDGEYEENYLPGSGLPAAVEFEQGTFTDGLHLGPQGYGLLSERLFELLFSKWPELRSQNLEGGDS
ncbi:SGNH hydrolase [Viridothelium virens]|uniref:SGNH hydrolase n=1 Tax=Viridothelium virens TaxID=1048519 RepID=A0A6A6HPA8_VIRVR|nr:SGNH hydrolase [Viridothelium virens]